LVILSGCLSQHLSMSSKDHVTKKYNK
jgi:hypothetical protein